MTLRAPGLEAAAEVERDRTDPADVTHRRDPKGGIVVEPSLPERPIGEERPVVVHVDGEVAMGVDEAR